MLECLDRYTVNDMLAAYDAYFEDVSKRVWELIDNLPFSTLCDINDFCTQLHNITNDLSGMIRMICIFLSKDEADLLWSEQSVNIADLCNTALAAYVECRKAYYETLLVV